MKARTAVLLFFLAAVPNAKSLDMAVGAPYLNLAGGARSAALGGACGALSGDMEYLWANPAGLAGVPQPQLSFTYLSWMNDMDGLFFQGGLPMGGGFSLGGNFQYEGAKDTYRDINGDPYGQFSVSDLMAGGALAYRGPWGRCGLGAKVLHENVEGHSGSGVLFDLGVGVDPYRKVWSLGWSVLNAGWAAAVDSPRPRAPTVWRASSALHGVLLPGVILTQELRYDPARHEGHPAFGGQWAGRSRSLGYAVRAGYDFQPRTLGGAAGWSAGAGLTWNNMRLDYVFTPYSVLGNTNRFTLGWEFSAPRRTQAVVRDARYLPTPTAGMSPGTDAPPTTEGNADTPPENEPAAASEGGADVTTPPTDASVETPTPVFDAEIEYVKP